MAFFECNFHSDALGKACTMNVVVPQKVQTQIGMGSGGGRKVFPVLYLLHGLSDNHSIWMRRTSIERYAADYDLVVVMPDGERSFYTDMATGAKFWTFMSEELPQVVAGFFPVSTAREDTFAAGLSMGGYGALKLALRRPDRFAACGALSAVADVDHFLALMSENAAGKLEADGFFGAEHKVPADCDLFALAAAASQLPASERPKILQICGTEDFLYQDNIRLRDHFRKLGAFDYEYYEEPGSHSWEFWDRNIQKILKSLPIRKG